MKTDESDIAIDRAPRDDQLPELAVRMLSDFARIVAAETRLLESNLVGAAQTFIDRARISSTLMVIECAGVVALLASLALMLHLWMPWWLVLGLVGMAAIILAEALRRSLIPGPQSEAQSINGTSSTAPGRRR